MNVDFFLRKSRGQSVCVATSYSVGFIFCYEAIQVWFAVHLLSIVQLDDLQLSFVRWQLYLLEIVNEFVGVSCNFPCVELLLLCLVSPHIVRTLISVCSNSMQSVRCVISEVTCETTK